MKEVREWTFDEVEQAAIGTVFYDITLNAYGPGTSDRVSPYRFVILRGPASCCAYLGVPEDHCLARNAAAGKVTLQVHYGLDYAAGKDFAPGWFFWGWDYAHWGDRLCLEPEVREIIKQFEHVGHGHRWTPDQVIADSLGAIEEFAGLVREAEAKARRKQGHAGVKKGKMP